MSSFIAKDSRQLPCPPSPLENHPQNCKNSSFSLKGLKLQSPFASRLSTIKGIAGVALAVISAVFVALAAATIISLPVAIPLAVISGLTATYLIASSILVKKKLVKETAIPSPDEKKPLPYLPLELQELIAHHLEGRGQDLGRLNQVSRSWKAATQPLLNLEAKKAQLFKKLGGKIASDLEKINVENIDAYLQAADRVKIRHLGLIEALGGLLAVEALPTYHFPKSPLGEMEYPSQIKAGEMCAPIMQGISKRDGPFIALRYEQRTEQETKTAVAICLADTIYAPDFFGGVFSTPEIEEQALERIARLVQRKPVGFLGLTKDLNLEEAETTLANGQSVIELL